MKLKLCPFCESRVKKVKSSTTVLCHPWHRECLLSERTFDIGSWGHRPIEDTLKGRARTIQLRELRGIQEVGDIYGSDLATTKRAIVKRITELEAKK